MGLDKIANWFSVWIISCNSSLLETSTRVQAASQSAFHGQLSTCISMNILRADTNGTRERVYGNHRGGILQQSSLEWRPQSSSTPWFLNNTPTGPLGKGPVSWFPAGPLPSYWREGWRGEGVTWQSWESRSRSGIQVHEQTSRCLVFSEENKSETLDRVLLERTLDVVIIEHSMMGRIV